MSTDTPSVEETLAWEAEKRPRAATIAVAAGLLTLIGNVFYTAILGGAPEEDSAAVTLTEALGARLEGQEPEGDSYWVRLVDFWGDNAALLSVSSVLRAIAIVGLGLTILFLYRATRARTKQIGRLPYYATLVGLAFYPVGLMLGQISTWTAAADFADAETRTAGTARDVQITDLGGVGLSLELLGTFAIALGLILVALNAMRVGLLTRFYGVLGIVAGVLTVFQVQFEPGFVRAFWLVGVGLVFAGRFRVPPAWETGRAEPWPTQQQLREQREAAQGDRSERVRRTDDDAAGDPADGDADAAPKPAHARKKRKRRR